MACPAPLTAASYSWNANNESCYPCRIFLSICAAIANIFCCYTVEAADVDTLLQEHPEYANCYFAQSLGRRRVDKTETFDTLSNTAKISDPDQLKPKKSEKEDAPLPIAEELIDIPTQFEHHFKVAVDGDPGCGKSTFINTMRGLRASDDDAAPVSVTGQEVKQTSFYELDNSIVLCEPAPVSTAHFGHTRYNNFDAAIVLCTNRVTKTAINLAKAAQASDKPFYIVRTKIDQDLRNARADGINEEDTQQSIYSNTEDEIQRANLKPSSDTFMISNLLGHKTEPDYHCGSASLRSLAGMGQVRAAM
ncbi:hypothetical protein GCM10023116_19340 [Kistimonas scapharcae]|uniref:IRG-type G domain-containing protein n=1 Tax=Kistimonas scapharcae TaxID=1036133 RepID=A0ABP8V339_9GAMM